MPTLTASKGSLTIFMDLPDGGKGPVPSQGAAAPEAPPGLVGSPVDDQLSLAGRVHPITRICGAFLSSVAVIVTWLASTSKDVEEGAHYDREQ
jgi:hypothetical protein